MHSTPKFGVVTAAQMHSPNRRTHPPTHSSVAAVVSFFSPSFFDPIPFPNDDAAQSRTHPPCLGPPPRCPMTAVAAAGGLAIGPKDSLPIPRISAHALGTKPPTPNSGLPSVTHQCGSMGRRMGIHPSARSPTVTPAADLAALEDRQRLMERELDFLFA